MTPPPPTFCLFCQTPMTGVHCKQICPNCGYREDCSDLFPETAYGGPAADCPPEGHRSTGEDETHSSSADTSGHRRSA